MCPSDDIGFLLKLINECIEKNANQALKPFDLTLSQARILFYLHDHQDATTSQKDLEEFFEVSHPTIIGILNRLEGKGFIRSEHCSKDKRVKSIFLTDKGGKVFCSMDHFRKNNEENMLQDLTDNQIKELKSLLKIVYKNIQES